MVSERCNSTHVWKKLSVDIRHEREELTSNKAINHYSLTLGWACEIVDSRLLQNFILNVYCQQIVTIGFCEASLGQGNKFAGSTTLCTYMENHYRSEKLICFNKHSKQEVKLLHCGWLLQEQSASD